MSAARKGKTPSLETRAKMSASRRGRKMGPRSPETRAKLSKATRALWDNNQEWRGNVVPKISEAQKKLWEREGYRGNFSSKMRGRPGTRKGAKLTLEQRQRRSEIQKHLWENPEYREHMSRVHKKENS